MLHTKKMVLLSDLRLSSVKVAGFVLKTHK